MASTKAEGSEMAQPKGKARSKMEGARSGDPLRPWLRSVNFIPRVKGYHVGGFFSREIA